MSLSASMWSGVSGLIAHGEKMNVVGNNIANVSTIGFKSQRMDFNDYLYVDHGSTSGPTQIGEGTSIYAVLGDFSQGSFESTNSPTDIAIDGNGFFGVRLPGSKTIQYTRAGDFYFNKNRELVNPEDMKVQGLRVDNRKQLKFFTGAASHADKSSSPWVGQGTPTDIVLDSWNCIPQRTTNITLSNLLINDDFHDKARSDSRPLTALFDLWDAKSVPPLPQSAYATQSSMKVFDESGTEHDLTIYLDKIQNPKDEDVDGDGNVEHIYSVEGLPAGYQMYEYLVTIPPEQDMRSYGGTGYDPASGTWTGTQPTKFYQDPTAGTNKMAGVLMQGVLIFNAAGQLVNQTAYTYAAQGTQAPNNQANLPPDAPTSWQPTMFSNNSIPVCTANFTAQPLANSVSETMLVPPNATVETSQAEQYLIEIDFGLASTSGAWANANTATSLGSLNVLSTINIGTSATTADQYVIDNGGKPFVPVANPTYPYTFPPTGTAGAQYTDVYQDGANVYLNSWGYDVAGNLTGPVQMSLPLTDINAAYLNGVQQPSPTFGIPAQPTAPAPLPAFPGSHSLNEIPYVNMATMTSAERKEYATANNGSQFISDTEQDGYAAGVLNGYDIDTNGVIRGRYSNNVTLPLWQMTLYDFRNMQGLRREGGNLYSRTEESGNARWSIPGNAGFGSTRAYNVEQSNVDMAREFVQMITTQRGFQANSKSVTTVDTMLETVIGMKR